MKVPAADLDIELSKSLNADFQHTYQAWRSLNTKITVTEAWKNWISNWETWHSFVTLTFREEKSPDVAWALFKWLIQMLNSRLFGDHYTKIVGHSYFSYVVGIETQKRGVLHYHMLTSRPVDYGLIHAAWGERCGFAWTYRNKSQFGASDYISKYVVKDGEVEFYRTTNKRLPLSIPGWWYK